MRILLPVFSPPTAGTWGGLTRALAIADTSRQRGHEIAFCASGQLLDTLRQRGETVYALPEPALLGLPQPLARRMRNRSQRTSLPVKPGVSFGSIWLVLVGTGFGSTRFLRAELDVILRAIDAFQPDAIFAEMDPAGYIAALIADIPLASTYATVAATRGSGSLPWRLLHRAIRPILREHNLPDMNPDELSFGDHVLKIIPSIPALDGADPAREDIVYTGSLVGALKAPAPDDFVPDPAKRYVFAYMGTGSVSLDVLDRVLPQVFPADGPLTCIVGAQSMTSVKKVGGVEFWPYVPAAGLLPHCDWTLCHGGQNTIAQSLGAGVPLIIFPGPIFERRYNAERAAATGAAIMGELPDFNAAWLRDALSQQSERATAARQQAAIIQGYGGAEDAVNALERWVTRNESPIPAHT